MTAMKAGRGVAWNPWWLALRARRIGTALTMIVLLGALIVIAFTSTYGFAGRGGAITPVVRIIPVALGTVVGIASGSVRPDVEKLGGRRLEATVVVSLLALTVFAILVAAVAAYVGGAYMSEVAFILLRGTLAYCGIAMMSAALLGHYYAWVLPIISVPAVTLMGFDNLGVPYPWNVLSAELSELVSWLMAFGAVLVGLAAITMTMRRATRRPILSIQRGS